MGSVSRKPSRSQPSKPSGKDEAEALRIISKGGKTPKEQGDRFAIHLKAPADLISRMDEVIGRLPVPTTRAAFIYKAIEEKLEQLEQSGI